MLKMLLRNLQNDYKYQMLDIKWISMFSLCYPTKQRIDLHRVKNSSEFDSSIRISTSLVATVCSPWSVLY